MTAKQFLKQYEEACKREQRYKTEYEKELELVDSVRSTLGSDGMPHGSGVSRKVEDQAIRLADKALDWKQAQLDAIQIRQDVFEMIHDIPGIEGDILIERYIYLRRWEAIAVLLHYSWNGVHKAHRRALRIVQERLDNRV